MMQIDVRSTVLVIDDEIGPRESLRFLLNTDYHVICVESVAHGIEALREHKPEAIILDIRMPGCDGIEGLRRIRQIDTQVAVIMLTGYGALNSAQEAVRHEASDYLEKPFDATEMRRTVEQHTARTRLRRKQEQLAFDVATLRDRLAGETDQQANWAELGQASAEFIHDLRNMLVVVCGTTELLRQDLSQQRPAGSPVPDDVNDSFNQIERAMRQCTDLLDVWQRLVRHEPDRRTLFPLAPFVQEVVTNCQAAARTAHARLACEVAAAGGAVHGDPAQLARAVTNLIQNAIQSLPPNNGAVTVSLSQEGARAVLRVTDNGCGIAPDHLPRIFGSDFSTKRLRGGMGLGLFIARKIVEMYGGEVTAASALAQGTVMTIALPLATEQAAGPAQILA